MDIIATITKINDVQEITSKKDGRVFRKFSFVCRTNEQYAKTICFTCSNEETWKKMNLAVGNQYQFSFELSSREWNGKWFTEAHCWRAVPTIVTTAAKQDIKQQQSGNVIPSSTSVSKDEDILPF